MSFRSLALALSLTGLVFASGCKHDEDKKPSPPAMKTTAAGPKLYDRLGGEKAVKVVVHDFVGRAATDSKVNFFRKDVAGYKEWKPSAAEVEHLEAQLVALIGQLTGGPQKYTGKDMKSLHAGMKIKESEFNALAGDLVAALNAAGVKPADRDELIGIVASTKKDIVEVP